MMRLGLACMALMLGFLLPIKGAMAADGLIIWDDDLALSLGEQLAEDARCDPPIVRPGCLDQALRYSFSAGRDGPMSALDQFALLVDRYKDLKLNTELRKNTKLKLKARVLTLYRQEAELRLSLSFRF